MKYLTFSPIVVDTLFKDSFTIQHTITVDQISSILNTTFFQCNVNRHTIINNVNKFVMSSIRYFPQSQNSFSLRYVKFARTFFTIRPNLKNIKFNIHTIGFR